MGQRPSYPLPEGLPVISNYVVGKFAECSAIYRELRMEYSFCKKLCWPSLRPVGEKEYWFYCFLRDFSVWRVAWNSIDASRYYIVPSSEKQEATFQDFARLLQYYHKRPINNDNEAELVFFLSKCTSKFRDFYLDILSRSESVMTLYGSPPYYIEPVRIRQGASFHLASQRKGQIQGVWREDGRIKGYFVGAEGLEYRCYCKKWHEYGDQMKGVFVYFTPYRFRCYLFGKIISFPWSLWKTTVRGKWEKLPEIKAKEGNENSEDC